MVKRLCQEMDVLAKQAPTFHLFNDNDEMDGYDSAFRTTMTEWAQKHKERLQCTHVLVRSRLVAMGVTVAQLVLRENLKMYADRKSFEAAFAALGGMPTQLHRFSETSWKIQQRG
jgi:hypothetical protein